MSSTKLVLYLLSNCSLCELYKSIFSLSADHNNCISRLRLQTLLLKMVEITAFLHEENSYGIPLVSRTIEECFLKVRYYFKYIVSWKNFLLALSNYFLIICKWRNRINLQYFIHILKVIFEI